MPRLAIIVVWLLFCGPLLTGYQRIAFRDTDSFYGPYYLWLHAERLEREEPQWNPYDDFGFPVIADGKSLRLYWPSYWLRFDWGTYAWRFHVFMSLHVLLAAWTAFELAVRFGCVPWASMAAAVSYAFGGAVYFQLTNPIYLIGAAWLPLALCGCYHGCVARTWKGRMEAAIGTGTVASLLIFGGDPQMAANTWLIAAASWLGGPVILSIHRHLSKTARGSGIPLRSPSTNSSHTNRKHGRKLLHGLAMTAMLLLVTVLLAAAQILPSAEWQSVSDRAAYDDPRSLWEMAEAVRSRGLSSVEWSAMWGHPPSGTHLEHVYQYSQPPWSAWELFWPNFSGRIDGQGARWANALPGGTTMWSPSIYIGAAMIVLALAQFRWKRGSRRDQWLTRIALFFAVGSLGYFGLGWGLEQIGGDWGQGAPLGGVYWLLVVAIPQYVLFRYPAKLFVIAALALAILAARQVTKLSKPRATQHNRLLQKQLLIVCCVSIASAIALLLFEAFGYPSVWATSVATANSLTLFVQRWAICHSLFVSTTFGFLWFAVMRRKVTPFVGCCCTALLMAVDLFIANSGIVPLDAATPEWDDALAKPHRVALLERLDTQVCLPGPMNLSQQLPDWVAPIYPGPLCPTFSSTDSMMFAAWHELFGEALEWRIGFFPQLPECPPVDFRRMKRDQARKRLQALFDGWYVERSNRSHPTSTYEPKGVPGAVEICHFEPNRIVVRCTGDQSGWLVMADLFAPGWQVEITDADGGQARRTPTCRFRGLFRAVPLERGDCWVTLTYQPRWLRIGKWISHGAWLLLALCVLVYSLRRWGRCGPKRS